MKKPILMLIALTCSTSALAACPPGVGAGNRSMIRFYEGLIQRNNDDNVELRRVGLGWVADENIRQKRADRQSWLAEKVLLGYSYLDSKCYVEARATFNEVWAWNSPDYLVYAQQAREGLNSMNSKGQ